MSRMTLRPAVIEAILRYEGKILTLNALMEELPAGSKPPSVRAVVKHLMDSGQMDLEVLSAGNSWRVNSCEKTEPASKDAGKSLGLFEQVGEMQDGSLVVRDEQNRLYVLKAL